MRKPTSSNTLPAYVGPERGMPYQITPVLFTPTPEPLQAAPADLPTDVFMALVNEVRAYYVATQGEGNKAEHARELCSTPDDVLAALTIQAFNARIEHARRSEWTPDYAI